jgi:hypothetical protein
MKITKQRLKEIIKEEITKSLKESKEVHIGNIAKKLDRLEQAVLNAKKGMQNMEQGAADDADLQDIRSTNAYFAKQQEVMNLEDKIELLTKQLKQLKQDQPGQLTRGVKEELGKVIKERKDVDDVQVGDYMEIMISDDGYDKDIEALDSKDDYNGNVSHYVPFKALVQVVAVSKHGEG